MRALKRRDTTPPVPAGKTGAEGFRYIHPETLHVSSAVDWWTWEERVKAHRRANNLSLEPNMMAVAENQLCDSIPPEWCDHAEDALKVNTRFTLSDLRDGMKAFFAIAKSGFNFVEQEEADRRAYICAGCPLNVSVEGCGNCNKIAGLIVGDVAQRKTPYDNKLRACAVCHCNCAAAVHFPMAALETTDTPEKQAGYPEFCWRKREGRNYRLQTTGS